MIISCIFFAFQIDIDLSKRSDQRLVVGLILLAIIFIAWLVDQFKGENISPPTTGRRHNEQKTTSVNNPRPNPPPPTHYSTARIEAERILRERQARIASTSSIVIQPTSKDEALNLLSLQANSSQGQIQNAYYELIKNTIPIKCHILAMSSAQWQKKRQRL